MLKSQFLIELSKLYHKDEQYAYVYKYGQYTIVANTIFTESPTTLTKNTLVVTLQCLHRIQSSAGTRSQKQEKTDPTTQML